MTSPLEQKKLRINGPVVVTANRLHDGAVVYLTPHRAWSTRLADAAVVTTAPSATELLRDAVADDVSAVGAYVAAVRHGPMDVRSPEICASISGSPARPSRCRPHRGC